MSWQIHWCQHKAGSPKKAESPAMDQCCQKELMVNELCVCVYMYRLSLCKCRPGTSSVCNTNMLSSVWC